MRTTSLMEVRRSVPNKLGALSKVLLTATLGLIAAACATAPTTISNSDGAGAAADTALSGNGSGDAVVVLAIAGPVGNAGEYQIRQVDLAAGTFTAQPLAINYAAWGFGTTMKSAAPSKPKPAGAKIVLLVGRIPSGDYAFTGALWNSSGLYTYGFSNACFNDAAVVIHAPPKKITIISSAYVATPGVPGRLATTVGRAEILAEFERVRVNYPLLTGDPVPAEIAGRISWMPPDGRLSDHCYGEDTHFIAFGAIDKNADAARAAALEAAKLNLSNSPPLPPAPPPPTAPPQIPSATNQK